MEAFAEFLQRRVTIVSLEDLRHRQGLEPLKDLLTLVVRPDAELRPTSRRLVGLQLELAAIVPTNQWRRLPHLSLEEIMTIAGVELAELTLMRAYQDLLAIGREQGREEGLDKGRVEGLEQGLEQGGQREAARLVLRQLRRRFGSVTAEQDTTIRGLPTGQLEDLGDALLDFSSTADLAIWLADRRDP